MSEIALEFPYSLEILVKNLDPESAIDLSNDSSFLSLIIMSPSS